MRELLERWAKLEPNRLRVSAVGAHLRQPDAWVVHWPVLTADPVNEPIILMGVIDAIEARGWSWNLFGMAPWRDIRRNYEAKVDGRAARRADRPAAALLAAYLAALEAEAKQ